MLPGFRFLFAAVVLSMSVLIFGLGAAALLRSAHEEFASLPSRRAPAEPIFSRPSEPPMPTLALLRFDPPVTGKAAETVLPASEAAPAETEKLAALPEEPLQLEAPKPAEETKPATETTVPAPAPVVENEAPPVADAEMKVAAVAQTSEPSPPAAPIAAQPATDAPALESSLAATKIATLGGPAVTIEDKTAESTTEVKPDRSIARKRAAQRARERRRAAARRARLAARHAAAVAQQQQQASPFGQAAATRAAQ